MDLFTFVVSVYETLAKEVQRYLINFLQGNVNSWIIDWFSIQNGTCHIDGSCRRREESDSQDSCKWCLPNDNQHSWTDRGCQLGACADSPCWHGICHDTAHGRFYCLCDVGFTGKLIWGWLRHWVVFLLPIITSTFIVIIIIVVVVIDLITFLLPFNLHNHGPLIRSKKFASSLFQGLQMASLWGNSDHSCVEFINTSWQSVFGAEKRIPVNINTSFIRSFKSTLNFMLHPGWRVSWRTSQVRRPENAVDDA